MRYWCRDRYIHAAEDDLSRFWGKVDKSGDCWKWKASTDRIGYGQMTINSAVVKAHVLSYLVHRGDIPLGADVLHTCDNMQCSNPEHLFLGTHSDNMKDKWVKHRENLGRDSVGRFVSLREEEEQANSKY